jgi:DNA-binding transcriptional MerR regulator
MTPARKLDDEIETTAEALYSDDEAMPKSADAFRTIGEAASELGLKTHVLRFWETKFDALKPMKRPDGRRYYRPEDMAVLRQLRQLLHVQGLTIRGAVRMLELGDAAGLGEAEEAAKTFETGASVRDLQEVVRDAVERGDFRAEAVRDNTAARNRLETLLADLSNLKMRLDLVRGAA